MNATDVVARILRFNKGREAHLLTRKFAEMRADAFGFYRGTCHLFYEDFPRRSALARAPLAWISGDLHPENFGSYRGRDGGVYFDVNDFDEANLGPCLWDVLRCLAGLDIGTAQLGILEEDRADLCRRYLYAYRSCLAVGEIRAIEVDDASGMVRELLEGVRLRPPDRLVKVRTERRKRSRRIIVDGTHALPLTKALREAAMQVFETWNRSRKRRNRYEPIDVAERVAGTGSMGVARYVVLARREGMLHLLDVKLEPASALAPYLKAPQPKWESESNRCVWVQALAQLSAPAPLAAVIDGRRSFVCKELQPTMDRVRWEKWHGRLERLEHLSSAMGQVTAWSHLRGAGTKGAATVKELQTFAIDQTWAQHAFDYAAAYAQHVREDYAAYCAAYDRKRFVTR